MSDALRTSLYFVAPRQVELWEEPRPAPGADQLLVQTLVSAISAGTEMLFYRGQAPAELSLDATIPALAGAIQYPFKYGYASIGQVIALGKQVDSIWQDQLVFAFHPHESHFSTTPAEVMPIPSDVRSEQAAFLPNMETAVNFVMDGQPLLGERVVVFGQGVVGLLTTALLARFPLAELITVDADPQRRALAKLFGATQTLAPDQVGRLDADLAYELSGNPAALDQAINTTGFGGRVVIGSWYGQKRVELNLGGHFHRSRIRLISSQVSTLAPELSGRWDKTRRFALAWSLLKQIDTERLITHRLPFAEATQAYHLLDQQPAQALQILLTYPVGRCIAPPTRVSSS